MDSQKKLTWTERSEKRSRNEREKKRSRWGERGGEEPIGRERRPRLRKIRAEKEKGIPREGETSKETRRRERNATEEERRRYRRRKVKGKGRKRNHG